MKKSFSFLLLLLFSNTLFASPSGAQLLAACENAQRNGYQSQQGMMCIWYVTPCDCHFGKDEVIPRVCLPADASHAKLADIVIAGIKDQPELLNETAEMAAARVLAPQYPCQD